MKKIPQFLCLGSMALILGGCATVGSNNSNTGSTPAVPAWQSTVPSADQSQINMMLSAAKDGQEMAWRSTSSNTSYEVVTNGTYVNDQGEPCRHYTLLVDPRYGFSKQTSANACRVNGQWQNLD